MFLPLLPSFVFSSPSPSLSLFHSHSVRYLGLFTFALSVFLSLANSRSLLRSISLPRLSCLRYLARTVFPVARPLIRWPAALYCICDLFLYYVPHAERERSETERRLRSLWTQLRRIRGACCERPNTIDAPDVKHSFERVRASSCDSKATAVSLGSSGTTAIAREREKERKIRLFRYGQNRESFVTDLLYRSCQSTSYTR